MLFLLLLGISICTALLFLIEVPQPACIEGPVLIVTAHPDDECMFFSPAILSLTETKVQVDLLCLSIGNYYGDGQKRRIELKDSAKVLGIRSFSVIDDPKLPDSPMGIWPPSVIQKHVRDHTQKFGSKSLLTFDGSGVSGHPNHCQIYQAIAGNVNAFPGIKVYYLKTFNVVLKYLVPLTLICAVLWSRGNLYCTPNSKLFSPHIAMFQHRSQLLWFRYLYVIFSSYMYFNVLVSV